MDNEFINKNFGSKDNFDKQLGLFNNQIKQNNINPEVMIKQMLSTGELPQDEFNRYKMIADILSKMM